MAWQDKLQPASLRGVVFEVESDDGTFGRRTQLHEYPQRDKPYAEDLGRKAREGSVTGFLIGPEYMTVRDQLISALETAGPGELVHPWYGRMMVTVQPGRVSHSNEEGGMCRVQFSFTESGDLTFPTAASAPGAQSARAVDALQAATKADFTKDFSVDNLPEFATTDAIKVISGALDTLAKGLSGVGGVLSDPLKALADQLPDIVRQPGALAGKVFDLFSKSEAVISDASGLRDITALNFLRAFTTLDTAALFKSSPTTAATPTRAQMAVNTNAVSTLFRQALVAQAAGISGAMALPVYDDATKLRDQLLTAIDGETTLADDDTYLALNDLRAKVYTDMTARIQNSARLLDITPNAVQPALVLAYDLYESVDREEEIVSRNKLRHPGFVPAQTIKVLSV